MESVHTIYLAAGCFWGAEKYLKLIRGVLATRVGFVNGDKSIVNPSYKLVYTDTTGYAECVEVKYDTSVLRTDVLCRLFFKSIDPTSLNRQGEDSGTRYRTGIYWCSSEDEAIVRKELARLQKTCEKPVCVEAEPMEVFYPAEDYHQNYLDKNPDGYCHLPLALFEFAAKANS